MLLLYVYLVLVVLHIEYCSLNQSKHYYLIEVNGSIDNPPRPLGPQSARESRNHFEHTGFAFLRSGLGPFLPMNRKLLRNPGRCLRVQLLLRLCARSTIATATGDGRLTYWGGDCWGGSRHPGAPEINGALNWARTPSQAIAIGNVLRLRQCGCAHRCKQNSNSDHTALG